MIYKNTPFLKKALEDAKRSALAASSEFVIEQADFERHRSELLAQKCRSEVLDDRAAFRYLTMDNKQDATATPQLVSVTVQYLVPKWAIIAWGSAMLVIEIVRAVLH